jgi:integrase
MANFRKRSHGWNVQVRRSGYPNLYKTFKNKEDALAWAREVESRIQRDEFNSLPRNDLRTLGDIMSRYVKDITSRKRGARPESLRIGKIIRHPICSIRLSKLTSMDMASYRDERLQTVVPASVVMELSLMSHAIDTARKEWGLYLPENVVKKVNKPRIGRGRDRRLLAGEAQKIFKACSECRNYYFRPLVMIAIETAMRRGELLNLKWEDIDLEKQVAHLEMTKNGSRRDVPLSLKALEVLSSMPHSINGRVFPLTEDAVKGLWSRVSKKSGITDLRFHDLRHEATSRFFEKGLNVMEVAAITGHKDLRMLQRYTHLRAEDLAKKLG